MVDTARSPNPALSGTRTRAAARLNRLVAGVTRAGRSGDDEHDANLEPDVHPESDEDAVSDEDAESGGDAEFDGFDSAALPDGMLQLSDLGTFVPLDPVGDEWDTDDDPTIAISGAFADWTPATVAAPPSTTPSETSPRTGRRLALAIAALIALGLCSTGVLALTHQGPFATMQPESVATALTEHLDDIAAPRSLGSTEVTAAAATSWATAVAQPATVRQLRLPVPLPVPADAYEPANYADIGRIDIPTIGLSTTLHQGMTLSSIDRGPSYWPGTARPGNLGNMVIAGHRVSNTRPFYRINELSPGDTMVVTLLSGTAYTYRVTGSEIVDPEELSIVGQRPAYEATLFACHPRGSARRRYVVHLELLGPDGQPVRLGDFRLVNE